MLNPPRLTLYLLLTLALTLFIGLIQPNLLTVTLYKLSLVTLAAWAGYWIDRGLFPYARPHSQPAGYLWGLLQLRRALIITAVVLAIALGA